MRPTDLFPQSLIDELLRLARLDKDWVEWRLEGGETARVHLAAAWTRQPDRVDTGVYSATTKYPTWLRATWASGADAFGMKAASRWLLDGPKIFRPTVQQCQALEQVEVRLKLEEYSQPYPAINDASPLVPGADLVSQHGQARHEDLSLFRWERT